MLVQVNLRIQALPLCFEVAFTNKVFELDNYFADVSPPVKDIISAIIVYSNATSGSIIGFEI